MSGLENCNRRDTEKYFGHKTLWEDRNAHNILFGKSQIEHKNAQNTFARKPSQNYGTLLDEKAD
jgi:hypothetical protein